MDQIINLIKAVYIDGVNFIEIEREIHILTNDALHTLLTHNPKEAKVNQEKCIISLQPLLFTCIAIALVEVKKKELYSEEYGSYIYYVTFFTCIYFL